LVLSLHGASVEAIGQADAYSPKSWAHIVCPTNRRPFGFDWEDWGRQDALEVLGAAQASLGTDPAKTYLTGHSMGGHGTWSVGSTHPDLFGAIAPSAGWISFWTYVGEPLPEESNIDRLLRRAASPSDTLARGRNLGQVGVYVLHGDADDNVPVAEARAMREFLTGFHRNFTYHEEPGQGHWWDLSDEPGADCVDWPPLFDFLARHRVPAPQEVRHVQFTTVSPAVASWCHWVRIEDQDEPLAPSTIDLRFDPGLGRFTGTTSNVARLQLDLGALGFQEGDFCTVNLDGQSVTAPPSAESHRALWLQKVAGTWAAIGAPSPGAKNPQRYGPFKQVFGRNTVLVYGTRGTPAENAWAYAKARYDAEQWYYRGNGAFDVMSDAEFADTRVDPDRNVILYGNESTNRAWDQVLRGDEPVGLAAGSATVGGTGLQNDALAALYIRPRKGSDMALVGVVGGTGIVGMRATERCPYFLAGVGYPDYILFGPSVLERGNAGVESAGFFGSDWTLE
ncbi:MAG TPA: prolyl oligopeptidase family serine peptidase, partial [bacterium]|nr:prolyl oligopeptidase family serine peptidase [bacterium]